MPALIDSRKLISTLWQDSDDAVFMMLDGASSEALVQRLYDTFGLSFECLLRGEPAADMLWVAPYLVKLSADGEFFNWLLSGWGQSLGVFVVVNEALDLRGLRRHFRNLETVNGPAGEKYFFRYYDPRVLSRFLKTCDSAQLAEMFGPVRRFCMESNSASEVEQISLTPKGELTYSKLAII